MNETELTLTEMIDSLDDVFADVTYIPVGDDDIEDTIDLF